MEKITFEFKGLEVFRTTEGTIIIKGDSYYRESSDELEERVSRTAHFFKKPTGFMRTESLNEIDSYEIRTLEIIFDSIIVEILIFEQSEETRNTLRFIQNTLFNY
jgi:hypothetical protein